eukprot:s163_g37.t1
MSCGFRLLPPVKDPIDEVLSAKRLHFEDLHVGQWFECWSSRVQGAGTARFREVLCQSKQTFGIREIGRYLMGLSTYTLPALGLAFLEDFVEMFSPSMERRSAHADELETKLKAVFQNCQVLIMPTLPRHGLRHDEPLLRVLDSCFTSIWNAMEFPSTAVPVGLHNGLPVGVQIVSLPGNDELTISVAMQMARAGDFDELPAHSHLCVAGLWQNSWALFFIGGNSESSKAEVVLCRVLGVMGGREAELRPCDCEECMAKGTEAVQFISRRTSFGVRQDGLPLAMAIAAVRKVSRGRRKVLTGLGQAALVPSIPASAETMTRSDVFPGEVQKSPLDSRTHVHMFSFDMNSVDWIWSMTVKPRPPALSYRALTLRNGMKVLLASDPDAISSAAALSVHLGFYSDPEDLPGPRDFQGPRHMLFLGTKEYPEENSFERFLTANSGALLESLKRFGSFFKEPLFTASATEREVSAIDSEFAKNRENDGFRLQQVLKSTAAESHPERHFGCGNRQTLLAKGPEVLREELQRYFQGYDPRIMALCVVGKEPLNVLQSAVEESLGAVPHRMLLDRPSSGNPYPPQTPQLLEAVPVSEARSLLLEWAFYFENFEARKEFLLAKAQDYVAQILGHEGPGSMHSILKGKGWVNRTTAGVNFDQDDFAIFRLSFDEGLRQKNKIIGAVFTVLARLREGGLNAVPDYTIEECRSLAELRWRFAEKRNSQPLCLDAVDLMQDATAWNWSTTAEIESSAQDGLSPDVYLSNRFLLSDPPADGPSAGSINKAIEKILEQLTPARARYRVFARDVAAKETEKFYGVKYAQTEIATSVYRGWEQPDPALLPGWHLPEPNKFIPQNFGLAWPQMERVKASALPPELIRNDERWRVFFKADRAFGVPKATFILQCWFPDPAEIGDTTTPASSISTAEGRDRLTEDYYAARLAGLAANCASTVAGISVSFSGYSDKLLLFVEEVLEKIKNFDGPTESEYARALDGLKREQASFDFQQPYAHAAYFSRLATFVPEYTVESLRAATAKVTREAVRKFSELLRSKEQTFFGQALIIGNVDVSTAQGILKTLDVLPFRGALKSGTAGGLLRSRFVKLDPGQESLDRRCA